METKRTPGMNNHSELLLRFGPCSSVLPAATHERTWRFESRRLSLIMPMNLHTPMAPHANNEHLAFEHAEQLPI
jgi:hypothetical protein